MRVIRRMIQATAIVATAVMFAPLSLKSAYGAGYDEYWPYKQVPRSVAARAFGPQDGAVLAISNNRPFSYNVKGLNDDVSSLERFFDGDIIKIAEFREPATNYRLCELLLKKALDTALDRYPREPWDVVDCYVNLAALYFRQNKYNDAENQLRYAIWYAERKDGPQLIGLANVLDYFAQVMRAQGLTNPGKFLEAEEAYKEALAIRLSACGFYSPYVAASYLNLAMLYNEWHKPDKEAHAAKLAHEIMGNRAYVSRSLSAGSRPVPTFMPGKTTVKGDLSNMVAFAYGVINKRVPESAVAVATGGRASALSSSGQAGRRVGTRVTVRTF